MAGFDGPGSSNVPGWVDDANSPTTLSSGGTVTLNSTYDIILVEGTAENTSGSVSELFVRYNSDSTFNYAYIRQDGAENTSSSEFKNVNNIRSGDVASFSFLVPSVNGFSGIFNKSTPATTGNFTNMLTIGTYQSTADITAIDFPNADFNLTVEVYGRNIA